MESLKKWHLEVLPPVQRALWDARISQVPKSFRHSF